MHPPPRLRWLPGGARNVPRRLAWFLRVAAHPSPRSIFNQTVCRLTRRSLLAAGVAAAGSLPLPRLVFARNVKPVKFTLPWVSEGSNPFTYVAKGMGFWEKRGLDVSIARGSGSVAAAQAIGAGQFDFGLAAPAGRDVSGMPRRRKVVPLARVPAFRPLQPHVFA